MAADDALIRQKVEALTGGDPCTWIKAHAKASATTYAALTEAGAISALVRLFHSDGLAKGVLLAAGDASPARRAKQPQHPSWSRAASSPR